MEAAGECARCEAALGGERWCPTCGKDSRPAESSLPTLERLEASRREIAWLAANPAVSRAERAAEERVAGLTAEEAVRARAETPPPALGEYADVGGVRDLLRAALALNAVAGLLVAAFAIAYLSVISGLNTEKFVGSSAVAQADDRMAVGGSVALWAFVVCGVVFIVWLYRAYRNLPALGVTKLRFGKGWAIGGWFVPVLAVWRPKQVLNDLWRASDPDLPANAIQTEWVDRVPPTLLAAWWGLWLLTGVLERIYVRFDRSTLTSAKTTLTLHVIGGVAAAAAAVTAMLVVGLLTERQQERAARLHELAGSVAPAAPLGPSPERPVVTA